MPTYALHIQYLGTPFAGWQRQPDILHPTVQEALEDAFQKVFGFVPKCVASGRTDAGVHATGQVISFAHNAELPLIYLHDGLNAHLRPHVSVKRVQHIAEDDFNARFWGTSRRYEYLLYNQRAHNPVWHGRATHMIQPLNLSTMQEAIARMPLGEGDFTSFRSTDCQSSTPMVNLEKLALEEYPDGLLAVHLQANHFLHNMVRIMVGTLLEIGLGKRPPTHLAKLLHLKDRRQAGFTAKPDGLYFKEVAFKPHTVLAECPAKCLMP